MLIRVNNCFCLAAFALLGSTLVTMLFVKERHMRAFTESLDEEQRRVQARVVMERGLIYAMATVAGLMTAFTLRDSSCKATAGALFVQTMVYLLWPKSTYMLNHVKTPAQSVLWLKQYTHMSRLGNVGIVAGVVAYFLLYNGKKN